MGHQRPVSALKRVAKSILFGPLVPQAAWERLHRLALSGMNIGSGSSLRDSGEAWVIDHLLRQPSLSDRPVLFDVGANVGDYAEMLRSRLGEAATLHCFEPSLATFARLKERFGAVPGVHLHPLALSDAPGEAVLYSSPDHSALSSMYDRNLEHVGLRLGERETVQLTTVDRFSSDNGIPRIHFMKLDCEGHELKVLAGAREMLDRGAVDLVQFEFGGCNLDSRTYLRDFFLLLSPRFRIYRILRRGVAFVERYREKDEIFTTTNFLAVRAGLSLDLG
jgi:FkbM family methyltransferase